MTQPLSSHGTLLQQGDGAGTFGTVTQTGSGLDDFSVSSPEAFYDGHLDATVQVKIDGTGATDTFTWSMDGGTTWEETDRPIAGAATPMLLTDGIYVEFAAITGHTLGDYWTFTATPVFTTVAEVVDIKGPSISQSVFDAPSQSTTWMKRVAGITNAGEVTLDVNFIPKDATHDSTTGLLSLVGSLVDTAFALVFNDAGTGTASEWRYSAYLTGFDEDQPVDGILKASVTLNINGQPVFLKGTS